MRRFVWGLPFVTVILCACGGEHTGPAATGWQKTADAVIDSGGVVARFYNAVNPYTRRLLPRVADHPLVRGELARFETSAYAYEADHSFVADGEAAGGVRTTVAVLSLRNTNAPTRDAVYLYCVGGADPFAVVPLRVVFEEDAAAPTDWKIGDGVWMGTDAPEAPGGGALAAFSIKRWAQCMVATLTGGLGSCLLNCRFLPFAYWQCVVVCTGGFGIFGTIHCTIMEF